MLLSRRATQTLLWVPAMRCVGVLACAGGAGAVLVDQRDLSDLVFVGATSAAVPFAALAFRRTRREGDTIVVRSLRTRGQVDATRVAVTLGVSGPNPKTATMSLRLSNGNAGIAVAQFSPGTPDGVCAQGRRIAATLDVPFDEERWRRWLAGDR